jgi:hypothetical protein
MRQPKPSQRIQSRLANGRSGVSSGYGYVSYVLCRGSSVGGLGTVNSVCLFKLRIVSLSFILAIVWCQEDSMVLVSSVPEDIVQASVISIPCSSLFLFAIQQRIAVESAGHAACRETASCNVSWMSWSKTASSTLPSNSSYPPHPRLHLSPLVRILIRAAL